MGRELQTLHSLRRMFVQDLRARVRRAQVSFLDINVIYFIKLYNLNIIYIKFIHLHILKLGPGE